MRQPLVIANWKMNGSREANAKLLAGVHEGLVKQSIDRAGVAVCPPTVYLMEVAGLLVDSAIRLGAQDLSPHTAGAHTGDISAEMLVESGCHYVIVGHSERRADHHESDALVADKYCRAAEAGLEPVLCLGETLAQREAAKTLDVVGAQLEAVIEKVDAQRAMVIAYEPVWAIGTGKTATAEQAQEVHGFIRQRLGGRGELSTILYGGSVKADNAKSLFGQTDIDGGLIGGASLQAESFVEICRVANES